MTSDAIETTGHDEAGRKASAAAWYGLFVLVTTMLFAYVIRQMLSLVAPSLQGSLGFTDLQLGILQGLGMAIFAGVASFPMGWLADRYGRRHLLAIGVACWSLATFVFAFQDSFGGLFAATVGISIGEAGLAPIIFAMIPDLFPERQRHTANFIFYGGSLLGSGAGMAVGGAMLHWLAASQASLPGWLATLEPWRIAMIAAALPGPLFFMLVATMPRGRKSESDRTKSDAASAPAFLPYAKANARTLFFLFGSIFATATAMTSAVIWFPVALPRAFAIDPTTVGVGLGSAIMLATLLGIVLPPATLNLQRRVREPIAVAAIFVWLTPLPAAFLPFIASPFEAYAIAAVQGALGVAASALMPGLIQDVAPPSLRSRVLAILGITNAFALGLSPVLVGAISGLLPGPRGMLQAITIVSMPALVGSAILVSCARRPYRTTVQILQSRQIEEPS